MEAIFIIIIIGIIQFAIFVWVLSKLHYIDKNGQDTTARLNTLIEYQKVTAEILTVTNLKKLNEYLEEEDTKNNEHRQTLRKNVAKIW